MSATLVKDLKAKGVRLEAASKLTFQSTLPLDAETVDTLKAKRDDLLTYLQDYSSLYRSRYRMLRLSCAKMNRLWLIKPGSS